MLQVSYEIIDDLIHVIKSLKEMSPFPYAFKLYSEIINKVSGDMDLNSLQKQRYDDVLEFLLIRYIVGTYSSSSVTEKKDMAYFLTDKGWAYCRHSESYMESKLAEEINLFNKDNPDSTKKVTKVTRNELLDI
jgi:hypothetical protein